MRSLIYWHASEEVEHKAVAYDVMQAAGVGYFTRIATFILGTLIFLVWVVAGIRMLLRQDGLSRADVRVLREEVKGKQDPRLLHETGQRIMAYFERDYHPNQADDMALAQERLAEIGLAGA